MQQRNGDVTSHLVLHQSGETKELAKDEIPIMMHIVSQHASGCAQTLTLGKHGFRQDIEKSAMQVPSRISKLANASFVQKEVLLLGPVRMVRASAAMLIQIREWLSILARQRASRART
jgi:hypothetical protein